MRTVNYTDLVLASPIAYLLLLESYEMINYDTITLELPASHRSVTPPVYLGQEDSYS
jgi:hypothetical protein